MVPPTITLRSQPAYSQLESKDERGPLNHGQVYQQIRGVKTAVMGVEQEEGNWSAGHPWKDLK
jgi:hypothetical protein